MKVVCKYAKSLSDEISQDRYDEIYFMLKMFAT